ncbi:MAG: phosphotransferase [Akkermansiaceae bacterium]
MWVKADGIMLKHLEGEGELYFAGRFACIFRRGCLLLALPGDRQVALATLALYQPQSIRARLLVVLIKLLIHSNLHLKLLPSREISFRENSPITRLKAGYGQFGFLLGNPCSDARCVIIARISTEGLVIDKVGLSEPARQAVAAEFSTMLGLPENLPGLLNIREHDANNQWAFYSCPMMSGFSPRKCDDDLVIKTLRSWGKHAQKKPLADSEQWQRAIDFAASHDLAKASKLLDENKNLSVTMGVMHGDFSPWNIKINHQGEVTVIDWEYASRTGPAVWDWLHYLLQRSSLVDKMSASSSLQVCRSWAQSPEGRVLMDEAGWGSHTELCIGSYLLYSNAMGRFEHENLLAQWIRQ